MWMERVLHDGLQAARHLRKSPGFTAAALVTLALGIGANALIFSVVNAVFLRPLPYRDPARLVWISEFFPKFNRSMVPATDFAAWKRQGAAFERIEAMNATLGTSLTAGGRPAERVQIAHVTPGFLAMTGVSPRLGGGFDPDAAAPSTPSAVISNDLWRGYLAGDAEVIGRSIVLNGKSHTVVGVMPPGFLDSEGADTAAWVPDAITPANILPRHMVRVIGRLKPGIAAEQAATDLERIARAMDDRYPKPLAEYHAAAHVRVVSLQRQLGADSETAAAVLMGSVGFLLLIACANVANLFLARAVARRKEIAVRTAIGAARRDIVRMLLAESLVLGGSGGALGMAVLVWGRGALKFLLPKALAQEIPIDWRVLAFAAGCSMGAGLLFGLAPAWVASRVDVNSGLKETSVRSGGRLPGMLAGAQIALSLVLLTGAGLLLRSFLILANSDPGFDAHNVLTADVALAPADLYGPDRQLEFFDRVMAGLRSLPSVRYAAVSSSPPMTTFNEIASGLRTDDGSHTDETVSITSASAEYFQALGIPLVAGRFFEPRDARTATPAAVINQSLARLLFADRDPVGRRILLDKDSLTVVGVVADMRHRALDDKLWPELFRPFEQSPSPWMTLLVRSAGDPSVLAAPMRGIVQSIDRSQPVFDVELLERRVSQSLAARRERALVLGAFAALALAIAVVGIYGVLSYSVARRTHEIGLRMALGAGRTEVLKLIVGAGLRLAAAGMAIGLAGAVALTRVLSTFLYGTKATDVATFATVCAVLAAAALCASYVPAHRAARVDPMAALRRE